jgi:tetratricopeptide (TPR) repeat protein
MTVLSDILLALVLAAVFAVVVGAIYEAAKWQRGRKRLYQVLWKRSDRLRPADIFPERVGYYKDFYYRRSLDDKLDRYLVQGRNLLIVGSPLSGKTRAAFEALRRLKPVCDVVMPCVRDYDAKDFGADFPPRLGARRGILLIDDLQSIVKQRRFHWLFEAALRKGTQIVATCRSGDDFDTAACKLDLDQEFAEKVEIADIDPEVAKQVARTVNQDWSKLHFDGTVGSLFMPLKEMMSRFRDCSEQEKTILRALREMYICGVYEGRQIFRLPWVKTVASARGLQGEQFHWDNWLDRLRAQEFLSPDKSRIQVEEAYLDLVVRPVQDESKLAVFRRMGQVLSSDPDALTLLADRASDIAGTDLDKAAWARTAIQAYESGAKLWIAVGSDQNYAMNQKGLGWALQTLSEVEDKAKHCHLAIAAYQEALKVYALDRFPTEYADSQNRLGAALLTLSKVEDKAKNCHLAVAAYQEALKGYTLARFPEGCAAAQLNLAGVFHNLSEVEVKTDNWRQAIAATQEALAVFTGVSPEFGV